jgi:hypothetical protein
VIDSQLAAVPFALDTGAANAIVVAYVPPNLALTRGLRLSLQTGHKEVGPTTVNVDGLGAKLFLFNGGDPQPGDIPAGAYVEMVYNGFVWVVTAPTSLSSGAVNVYVGASGAVATPANSNLTVESNTNTGMTLLAPAASVFTWAAATPTDTARGGVRYNDATGSLIFIAAGNTSAYVDLAGGFHSPSFTGAFTGNLTGNVTGNVTGTASGNPSFGPNTFNGRQVINANYTGVGGSEVLVLNQVNPATSLIVSFLVGNAQKWLLEVDADSTATPHDFRLINTVGTPTVPFDIDGTTGIVTLGYGIAAGGASHFTGSLTVDGVITTPSQALLLGGGRVSQPATAQIDEIGTNNLRQKVITGNRVTDITDRANELFCTNSLTVTVAPNATVPYFIGTPIMITADAGKTVTVNCTDTMRLLPVNTIGATITITGPGYLMLLKKKATEWWGIGVGCI